MDAAYLESFDGHDPAVRAFHSNLSSCLQKLEESIGDKFFTIDWMKDAVDILRSSHAALLNLAETLYFPKQCINTIMDDTVRLLSVCKALTKGISTLQNYAPHVHIAVEALQEGGAHYDTILQALYACDQRMWEIHQSNKLFVDMQIVEEEKLWFNFASRSPKPFDPWGVIYPMKGIISFVSMILLWGFLHMDSSYSAKLIAFCSTSAWAKSISNSHQRVIEQIALRFSEEGREKILLKEFGNVQACLDTFLFEFQSFEERVSRMSDVTELRQTLNILKCGLDSLEWTVDDLFDDIVEGRKRLLSAMKGFS